MTVIVDVQGFNTSKKTFIPKELAVYDGVHVSHYIFKAPFSIHNLSTEFKQQVFWLINNHHCIDWNEGFTPLFMFPQIIQRLTKDADSISVKGCEKATYIKKFVSKPVIEFREQPALTSSIPCCFYHLKSPSICALSNVYFLYETFVMK